MSGIYGLFTKEKSAFEDFEGLAAWNRFYGNEDCVSETNIVTHKNLCFRLGISAERFKSSFESQRPIGKNDKSIFVSDALIYGRDGRDVRTKDLCDEAYLYEKVKENGIDVLKEINGDFAGALYDYENSSVTLFRDHMGVRPLFYYFDEKILVFSTDIRGITSLKNVNTELDEKWVFETITGGGGINSENTEYRFIKCVPPGGFVKISLDANPFLIQKGKYWIPGEKKYRYKNDRLYIDRLRELITDAIKIRIGSIEGSVGAELSGGLDSSVIDILINRMGHPCKFFSWTPGEDEVPMVENDERLIIKDICESEKIDCHYGHLKLAFGKESMLAHTTPLAVDFDNNFESLRDRYAFPAYISTLEICEAAQFMHSNGVKVIFTGHGGDEGVSHRCNVYELWYYHEYYHYFKTLWARTYKSKNRVKDTFRLFFDNQKKLREVRKKTFQSHTGAAALLNKDFLNKFDGKAEPLSFSYNPKDYIRKGGSRDRLDVVAFYGAHNRVRYLSPFVDYRLVDFALGIPRYMFVNGFQNRYIYRKAFEDIMPKSLYKLQSKDEPSLKAYWANHKAEKEQKEALTPEMRANVFEYIDGDTHRDFFDMEVIKNWCDKGEASGIPDGAILSIVGNLAAAENMVKKSREYVIK